MKYIILLGARGCGKSFYAAEMRKKTIKDAFINCVELALDWNLPIESEKLKLYYELIKERSANNEP